MDELRKEERKKLKNVIIGEPYDPKSRVFDFHSGEIQKGPMFRSIPKWKFDDFKNQYRPMNKKFVDLITMNADKAGNLSYKERTEYKMGVCQLILNLNYISCTHKPICIRGPCPVSLVKTRIMKHFH